MKKRGSVVRGAIPCLAALSSIPAVAQILVSSGGYRQNFDSLGSANANWTNNLTLPGWYSGKGSANSTNYFADTGTLASGGIHSYGVAGVSNLSDRALGSIGASSIIHTYGMRFLNDTGLSQTNITVSYTGGQWRSGTTPTPQTLAFSYQISSAPFSNSLSGTWTVFSSLSFISPNLAGMTNALDGNPYDKPFGFTSIMRDNLGVRLQWESVLGQPYCADASLDLRTWTTLASNLTATTSVFTFSTNTVEEKQFYRVYRQP